MTGGSRVRTAILRRLKTLRKCRSALDAAIQSLEKYERRQKPGSASQESVTPRPKKKK